MEFLDWESRSRFVFQSKPPPISSTDHANPSNVQFDRQLIFLSVFLFTALSVVAICYVETEPFKSLLIWLSLSILLGPFAPSRVTGGDVRVGKGPAIDFREEEESEEKPDVPMEKRGARRRAKPNQTSDANNSVEFLFPSVETTPRLQEIDNLGQGPVVAADAEEIEWREEDLVLLKKQMAKNPAGKPGRWEAVTMAFNGRHKIDSVIKKAKEVGEMRPGESGDYERFLKMRKPVDARVQEEIAAVGNEGGGWSGAEDVALLNAMKAFPKEAPMRWEKIAAALPGRSKAACLKRVSELKKDFRNSKNSL